MMLQIDTNKGCTEDWLKEFNKEQTKKALGVFYGK